MGDERKLLEPGMILLDPNDGRPRVWTVKSAGPRQATIIAHYGTVRADARLRTNRLPEDWSLIGNQGLAALLMEQREAVKVGTS